jgi:hypothetical protein
MLNKPKPLENVAVHHIIYLYVPFKLFNVKIPFIKKKQRFFLCTTYTGLKLMDDNAYIVSDPHILNLPEIAALWQKYKNHYLFLNQ